LSSDQIYIKNKKSGKQNQPKIACSAGVRDAKDKKTAVCFHPPEILLGFYSPAPHLFFAHMLSKYLMLFDKV
jgi:hypothetical protein